MGLRTRLWLVLGAIALVPLLIGGVLAIIGVSRAGTDQAWRELDGRSAAIDQALSARCETLGVVARALATEAVSNDGAAATRRLVDDGLAQYAALLRADGNVLAEAGDGAALPPGARSPCTQGSGGGPLLVNQVQLSEPTRDGASVAVAASPIDDDVIGALAGQLGFDDADKEKDRVAVAVVGADGQVLATTAPPDATAALAGSPDVGSGRAEVAGWLALGRPPHDGVPYTVVVARLEPDVSTVELAVLIGSVAVIVVALLLGYSLARRLTEPLDELTAAAEAVAHGDFEQTIPVRGHDETGRLASAFNDMTRALRGSMSELASSRDELRASLVRLGGALGSTHDVPALMQVVLDSAVTLTGATGGAAWVSEGAGDLNLVATSDEGRGRPRTAPEFGLARADDNPAAFARSVATSAVRQDGDTLVVSLSRGRVVGVLELDLRSDKALDHEVVESLRGLAGQASIAIDNVLLHQEAQQQSITDPLTGLGNFRYMSSNLAREIERATRFSRPLAVLMLDLDHFKSVNDTYGHSRGDSVLRELASRVHELVREVDTAARYGGEEFVLVLPETDLEGGTRLADRICAAVRRQPFRDETGDGPPISVTVSIGVAAFPVHGSSPAVLMRTADTALYEAKTGGRDRWCAAPT